MRHVGLGAVFHVTFVTVLHGRFHENIIHIPMSIPTARQDLSSSYPRVPCGMADFKAIRLQRCLYVDKTRFVRELENESYVVLVRPRRFGKTCWVSLLEHYYDRTRADAFAALFGGTDIGAEPTEHRNRYVVLRFDFSAFDDTPETLQERFDTYCHTVLRDALERNRDLFPEATRRRILSHPSIGGKLNALFLHSGDRDVPLYVLIDEYDTFVTTVLAHRDAETASRLLTHGDVYRNFFATLKAGTSDGLERLFMTGVTPVSLDDVTSGFNIARHLSLDERYHEMLGFTEPEVRGLLETYRECGAFSQDVDAALEMMREWYGGYRFAERAQGDLYHTDMVLHFLAQCVPNKPLPDELIDTNARSDYDKLRHLLTANRRLTENLDLLRHVIDAGSVDTDVQPIFSLERLDERENFLSLLYYFGLLSIRGVSRGWPRLSIPNQTVKRLTYDSLRDAVSVGDAE